MRNYTKNKFLSWDKIQIVTKSILLGILLFQFLSFFLLSDSNLEGNINIEESTTNSSLSDQVVCSSSVQFENLTVLTSLYEQSEAFFTG